MTIRALAPALALTLGVAVAAPPAARAALFVDPAGDFLGTYTGPRNGALDVIGAEVLFDGSVFRLHAVVNAPIQSSPVLVSYVWGFNRGAGTAGFASLGLNNVLFDRVVLLRSDGTGTVAGVGDLPGGAVTVSGNEIFGTVGLAALLPSTGFTPGQYTWNLWPRSPGAGTAPISDFAPDTFNVQVTSVPAPAAAWLVASGVMAAPLFGRLRRPRA